MVDSPLLDLQFRFHFISLQWLRIARCTDDAGIRSGRKQIKLIENCHLVCSIAFITILLF